MLWILLWCVVISCWGCLPVVLSETVINYGVCSTPKNESGLCLHITDCDYLYQMLNANQLSPVDKQFLAQSQCGYDNTQTVTAKRVLICCPDKHCRNESDIAGSSARLSSGNILPEAGVCGSFLMDRLVGGNTTQLGEFPWMALLEYKKPNNVSSYHCGGSLINARYVLTAAHCVKGDTMPRSWHLTRVRLGEWDLNGDPDCVTNLSGKRDCALPHVDVDIDLIIAHELYEPGSVHQFHDIALLRLAESVAFNTFVRPICLPLAMELQKSDFHDHVMHVAGWGQTEKTPFSAVKLKITVKAWPLGGCQSTYRSFQRELTERQLCAGGEENVDTCRGDSGGPLMVRETLGRQGIFFLAGIVSYGPTPCGLPGWPAVYTNVGSYMDWIRGHLQV